MPMSIVPVSIYLDVDGVVNPFSPFGVTDWGGEWHIADAGILEVAYAPELVAELNLIAQHPAARFVWLTTWERLAPEFLCPAIGLNGREWPVLSSEGWDAGPEWWKLTALQKDLATAGADRFIWLDDQLGQEAEAQSWADYQQDRVLCISPDPRRGLSRRDLAAVRDFLG
ncbi:HAD domain-containing protein [Paenarthrobacter sp. NPDC090520]|uniref:HAD domain-containing protein n=1 Tax=Paenarthrobacter sp. NPDC090520 TaxID=3364382 RepID=UPI0038095101